MTTAALRRQWESYAEELAHPAVELTAEEFAPVLVTFKRMRSAGHPFDATLAALMGILEAQMVTEDADREDDDPTAGTFSDDDPDDDQDHDDSTDTGGALPSECVRAGLT